MIGAARWPVAAAVVVALLAAGCAPAVDGDENGPTASAVAPTVSKQDARRPVGDQEPARLDEAFPPAGVPLLADDEIEVGELQSLGSFGPWLLGVREPSVLVRIDPATGETASLDLGIGVSRTGPPQYTVVGEQIWVVGGPFRNQLLEVDPAAMNVVRRVELDDDHSVPSRLPQASLWLLTLRSARQVNTLTGEVGDMVALEVDPGGIAADDEVAWVSQPAAAEVARIDGRTGTVDTIPTEPGPTQLVLDGDSLWVSHPPTATISRIDTRTSTVVDVIDVDLAGDEGSASWVGGLTYSSDSLWAAVRYDGSVHRPVIAQIDRYSAQVRAVRTLHIDIATQAVLGDVLWLYRPDTRSVVPVDTTNFADEPTTSLDQLLAPESEPTSDEGAPEPTENHVELESAFRDFTNPSTGSGLLDLGDLAAVRDDLLELLAAQPEAEVEIIETNLVGQTGTVRFDVFAQGDTVIVRAAELIFQQTESGEWSVDPTSLCELANGVGLDCLPGPAS